MSPNNGMTLDDELAILTGEGSSRPEYTPPTKATPVEGDPFGHMDDQANTKAMAAEEERLSGFEPASFDYNSFFDNNDSGLTSMLQDILDRTFKFEGGFVNAPEDKGGPTNMGITLGTYRNYVDPNGTIDDIKALSKDQAKSIYIDQYFYGMGVDKLPEDIQDLVFDMNVLHGPKNSAKLVQRAINGLDSYDGTIAIDGVMGNETVKALNDVDVDALRNEINKERESFVKGIVHKNPNQKKFLKGWLNRISQFDTKPSKVMTA